MKCLLSSSLGSENPIMGDQVCIDETRITVYHLLLQIDYGLSNEEIIHSYPSLKGKEEPIQVIRMLYKDLKGQF